MGISGPQDCPCGSIIFTSGSVWLPPLSAVSSGRLIFGSLVHWSHFRKREAGKGTLLRQWRRLLCHEKGLGSEHPDTEIHTQRFHMRAMQCWPSWGFCARGPTTLDKHRGVCGERRFCLSISQCQQNVLPQIKCLQGEGRKHCFTETTRWHINSTWYTHKKKWQCVWIDFTRPSSND